PAQVAQTQPQQHVAEQHVPVAPPAVERRPADPEPAGQRAHLEAPRREEDARRGPHHAVLGWRAGLAHQTKGTAGRPREPLPNETPDAQCLDIPRAPYETVWDSMAATPPTAAREGGLG